MLTACSKIRPPRTALKGDLLREHCVEPVARLRWKGCPGHNCYLETLKRRQCTRKTMPKRREEFWACTPVGDTSQRHISDPLVTREGNKEA